MSNDDEKYNSVWRWDGDTHWHYFCSMQYEAVQAQEATNPFMRFHAIRACIYFAIATAEAMLNDDMRRHLESEDSPEREIWKRLRNDSLQDKINKWPSEICGKDVLFPNEFLEVFNNFKAMRDEITHPKRRDHSILVELEEAEPGILVDAVARAIVTLCHGKGVPFPYWVLGWNYVGMNADPTYPCQTNNMNGFLYSFAGMGFNVDTTDLHWDKKFMMTIGHYEALLTALKSYPGDIEPYWIGYPQRPRLTRRWWDYDFLKTNYQNALKESGDDPRRVL